MIRTFLFTATTALCLLNVATYAATPDTSNVRPAGNASPIGAHIPTLTVLYDQQVDDSGIGIVSQMFEAAYSIYDSLAADDFTVPAGSKWTVEEVDVTGQYFNGTGPAGSENVTFYRVEKGLPHKVLATYKSVKGEDTSGSFAITLPSPMKLRAGRYFVSVQANLAYAGGGGEWDWENTTTAQSFGNPAAWQNPANGFGTGCTKYRVEDTCFVEGQGPDHLFSLLGKAR